MSVLGWQALKEQLQEIRQNKKVVFTNGCFDLLHIGHVEYLKEAKAQGDILVIGLNSDASVRELKGAGRPIQNERDRADLLDALKAVDFVTVFSEATPKNLIEFISPDILVKGGDYEISQIVGAEHVLSHGGEVKSLSFVDGRSTSDIVDRIKKSL